MSSLRPEESITCKLMLPVGYLAIMILSVSKEKAGIKEIIYSFPVSQRSSRLQDKKKRLYSRIPTVAHLIQPGAYSRTTCQTS